MTINVMFVCLGNICRSPTAHGIFQHKVEQAGLADQIYIESSGTGGWHVGKAPDPRTLSAASRRGYDFSALRAQQVTEQDFQRFDYILAMDEVNLEDLRRMAPADFSGHLGLFLNFGNRRDYREVPDPYYGGGDGFNLVLDLVESAAEGLLDHLQQDFARPPLR
ncbi:low molecular weight protein-tyrosine-phosphatase [Marinimicrobium sp. ABcell2]|uniref:low molecular weight protein-tyrosine-phosphatase n=1 Tax=Marinimicrobium sp. ABcell2 TaxID=3069751 RepID=UPI0027B0B777|nr:low molecular weight protein-tyrosine-phosphatase [Marinimicrobium sp. ABcell2]MDQ2075610.1 low molecular weight protein-tyrosine-phosphatase [Marinimicrobium sp. ABcell2]